VNRTNHATADPLVPFLERDGVVVLDGGLATELERRGADLGDPLWSARLLVEAPDLIRAVHGAYFAAGADVATTASYQASFEGFARRGIGPEAAVELLRRSVRLAAEARDAFWAQPAHRAGRRRPLVAASIGSFGAFLADGSEYRGDYGLSTAALMAFHRPRLAVLAASGADLLACETIPSLQEGEALVRLLCELPGAGAWLSFSCRDGARVCHGEAFTDCAALAEGVDQVVAVGVNCTAPRHVEALLRAAGTVTAKPLVAYPNRGEGWDAAAQRWVAGHEPAPPDFAELARVWRAAGARLIGGCCRTTPDDIRALARALGRASPRNPLRPRAM
jgi:homocysteine S-methyltransferase